MKCPGGLKHCGRGHLSVIFQLFSASQFFKHRRLEGANRLPYNLSATWCDNPVGVYLYKAVRTLLCCGTNTLQQRQMCSFPGMGQDAFRCYCCKCINTFHRRMSYWRKIHCTRHSKEVPQFYCIWIFAVKRAMKVEKSTNNGWTWWLIFMFPELTLNFSEAAIGFVK